MTDLLDQIDKVIQWDAHLNSDRGPLNLGEAMAKIRNLALETEWILKAHKAQVYAEKRMVAQSQLIEFQTKMKEALQNQVNKKGMPA